MSLGSPQFLLLLPVLALAGWQFRRLELWRPLRILALLLATLALCEPRAGGGGGSDLWMLVDRSRSAERVVEARSAEWRSLLERSRPSPRHRLRLLDYAEEVALRSPGESGVPRPGPGDLTRTALAVREAVGRIDAERRSRILLFTDGYSTEPLAGLAERLVEAGVPMDYRLLRDPGGADFRVESLSAPEQVLPGEAFLVEVALAGNADAQVPLTVSRGGAELLRTEVEVAGGRGSFRFSDRIPEPGAHLYSVRIEPEQDAHEGNNTAQRWVEATGDPRLLLVTRFPDDPVETALRAQGFEISVRPDPAQLDAGALAGARAVLLNNVAAHELPAAFLEALPFFVSEQGGGLLMAGGADSFGSGGYHQSAADALLPVSMELQTEHRKLAVAMAIVMDRSGSMRMVTPSGHTKMKLANEGAARAVEMLGDMDSATVFAVDTRPHPVSDRLLNVGANRGELVARIRRIESMGGGIYVYTGMKAAWEHLRESDAGQRHLILFSDAADSEEPGRYRDLIAEMRRENATISVIGLGTERDKDAAFLVDIARRGGGRIFFTEIPEDLPGIFAQETATVARSSFIDEPVPARSTGRWIELARSDLAWPGHVDGYNLSYLREGDTAALLSGDEFDAPLVAFGRRGLGRTAAVTFPVAGEHSGTVRDWSEAGDFLQTLARWLLGEETPPGLALRRRIEGSGLRLDLHYDPAEWGARIAAAPPRLVLRRGLRDRGRLEEPAWERVAPGRYSAWIELDEGEPVRGAVQTEGAVLPFGPLVAATGSEWDFDPARVEELRETARASGGREVLDLREAWRSPPGRGSEPVLGPVLALLAVVIVLESFATRTGWRLANLLRWPPRRILRFRALRAGRRENGSAPPVAATPAAGRPAPAPLPATVETPPPAVPPETPAAPPPPAREDRKSRFRRAKRGR